VKSFEKDFNHLKENAYDIRDKMSKVVQEQMDSVGEVEKKKYEEMIENMV